MFDRDAWQEIFATIKKNKLRTFLTCFGVYWGIFMLVVMLGAGNGLRNGILAGFNGTATNSFFCWAQKTSKPYKGMKPGRNFNFTNDDFKALRQLPELDIIAPMNRLGGYGSSNNVVRGLKTGNYQVSGVYPEVNQIEKVDLTEGRFLNYNDILQRRKVCVIGKRVREILFKPTENPLGDYIRVNGVYFRVIGVTKPSAGGQNGQEQSETVNIPFTTFQQAFNYGDVVGWFAITAKPGTAASDAEDKALAVLRERHKIAPEDQLAIGHWNMEKEFTKLSGLFFCIDILVWVVGIGTLLAGIIGVSNIMLIIVKERTKEIGIRRAIGAPPALIVRQIIIESVFLTAIAGYVGLVVSVSLLELVSNAIPVSDDSMFIHPGVDVSVALTALAILIVAGALAGLIPARKAIAVSPVEALRAD